jgi:diguanylate cyclase (GGDEF)-like protein
MDRPFIDQPLPEEIVKPDNLQKLVGSKELLELENQAFLDPLTKLLNRRAFESIVHGIKKVLHDEALSGNRREHHLPKIYALLLLDIDHFKSFNDTYGHDVGDAVLQAAAIFFEKNFRPSDRICRWGGEEFVILFEDYKKENFVERLSKRFLADKKDTVNMLNFTFTIIETDINGTKEYRVPGEAYSPLPHETIIQKTISFSGGLVAFSPLTDDLEVKVKEADGRLYEAKHSGRDRIEAGDL